VYVEALKKEGAGKPSKFTASSTGQLAALVDGSAGDVRVPFIIHAEVRPGILQIWQAMRPVRN
jgi:hypothetical protein